MSSTISPRGYVAKPSKLALRGIRFIEGEEGAAPAAPTEPAVPTPPAPVPAPPAPTPAPAAQSAPAPATPTPPATDTFDRAYVSELRTEAKSYRTERDQARAEKEALDAENAKLKAQIAERDRSSAIQTGASAASANIELLLDSRGFENHMADIDVTDAEAVKTAITAWLDKNPTHRATPAIPGRSGGPAPQGSPTSTKPTTLEAAVAASLT